MLQINLTGLKSCIEPSAIDYSAVSNAHRMLSEHTGAGSGDTGWLKLPENMLSGAYKQILSTAARIRSQSALLVVIGVGGSYLGARAGLELLFSPYYNLLQKDTPDLLFAGNSLSAAEASEVLMLLGERDFSVLIVSKSGKTLETNLSLRIFKNLLERKYGVSGAKKRIFAVTGKSGPVRDAAETDGWTVLDFPEDVGGRYSVLSPAGLLPLACAGADVEKLLCAGRDAMQQFAKQSPLNPAWQYAAARQALYRKGKSVELLCCYEPAFRYMAEWWKQLFGESEGKNGVGLFPASLQYSTDLHSLGQFVQEGPRCIFESTVSFRRVRHDCTIPFAIGNADGLNDLAGKSLDSVNRLAEQAVRAAHISGGVPEISLSCDAMDEAGFAELVCFFEVACALSGYILGVNPFDQPGVEAYKQNLARMLRSAE